MVNSSLKNCIKPINKIRYIYYLGLFGGCSIVGSYVVFVIYPEYIWQKKSYERRPIESSQAVRLDLLGLKQEKAKKEEVEEAIDSLSLGFMKLHDYQLGSNIDVYVCRTDTHHLSYEIVLIIEYSPDSQLLRYYCFVIDYRLRKLIYIPGYRSDDLTILPSLKVDSELWQQPESDKKLISKLLIRLKLAREPMGNPMKSKIK